MSFTPVFEAAYEVNSTPLPFPATGHWNERESIGVDGNNRKIYPAVRSFTINWTNLLPSEWRAVYGFWQLVVSSGFVTVTLPALVPPGVPVVITEWGIETDLFESFQTYSGCVIDEPVIGPFEQRTYSGVQMLIRNIVA